MVGVKEARILIVDDEISKCEALRTMLENMSIEVQIAPLIATTISQVERLIEEEDLDIVFTDMRIPYEDSEGGLKVIDMVRDEQPGVPTIVVTSYASIENAVQSVKRGAFDYLPAGYTIDELELKVQKALEHTRLKAQLSHAVFKGKGIIGTSESMKDVFNRMKIVADTDATIVIYGESGTGKGVIAEAIGELSPRFRGPFVPVSCAAIPESLIESELFGHERGAFTGAVAQKKGRFELADGGTLFLDEIGEMSPNVQPKLLRFLEAGEFERVGGTETLKVDARLICATNKDLQEEVEKRQFREDLFYRINVVPIHIPPLRERREDIPLLASHFLRIYRDEYRREVEGISESALALLIHHDWPGNVRELRSTIQTAVVFCDTKTLQVEHLERISDVEESSDLPDKRVSYIVDDFLARAGQGGFIKDSLDQFERQLAEKALQACDGNIARAGRLWGITRESMWSKLKKHGAI